MKEANANAALKLALEALEMVKANADDWQERTGKEIKGWMQPVNNSITAIKEALAQPEQEPIGFYSGSLNGYDLLSLVIQIPVGTNLYTTPPQRTWVPLTIENIVALFPNEFLHSSYDTEKLISDVRIVEAKLKEKNT